MRGKRQDTKFHSVLPHVFKTGQLVRSTVCEVQIVVTPTAVVTRSGHRGEVLEVLVVLPLLFFFFFLMLVTWAVLFLKIQAGHFFHFGVSKYILCYMLSGSVVSDSL